MAGLPLPSASNMQPLGGTRPRSNIYEAREVNIGRVQGRFSGGPQIISGVGEGLKGLAGGLDKWAAVLEKQEQQKQTFEAMEETQAFKDKERVMLEQMNQMKGRDGFDAPAFAQSFYEKEGQALTGKARGDFQKMYFESFLNRERSQGLDAAFVHRTAELGNYKNQVWAGQEALALDAIEQDPSQLDRKLMEMDELENQLEPGMAPELRQARSSARWKKGLALSIATLTQNGEFDKAEQLVQSGGVVAAGGIQVPAQAAQYADMVDNASKEYGVPQNVIWAVMKTESSFDSKAVSPTGVKGLMQVTGQTYKGLGFTGDRADPNNSIKAGTKLLSLLYKKYGRWDYAFADYNGGPDAVRGLKTGNWGVWAGNASKQREIKNYAPTVLKNMQGQAGITQLSADQKKKYMDYIGQERVKTQVRTLTAEVGQSFENDIRVDALNTVQKGYDEIAQISDPERRQEALSMYQQEVRFQDMRVNAADSTAVEGFFTMSENMGWSPEKQLEMLKEVPGLSRETRDKLKDGIIDGTANKPTVENEMAEQDLKVMISDGMRANSAMTETEIKALANQAGLTVSQTTSALKYARDGGLAGDSSFASNVKELFKELSGDPKAQMPPGFVNMVFAKMDPGQSGRDAERQGVIRVMQAMASGESNTGYIFDTDETAAQAQAAGRLDIWTPKVTRDEKTGIDAALQANGLKITSRNRELWKKSEQLGLSLTQAELEELERQ